MFVVFVACCVVVVFTLPTILWKAHEIGLYLKGKSLNHHYSATFGVAVVLRRVSKDQ